MDKMKGFVDYQIDYVVKFGGSILEEDSFKDVLNELSEGADM